MRWLVQVFSPPAAGRSQGKRSDAKRKAEGSAWLEGCGFASVLTAMPAEPQDTQHGLASCNHGEKG